MTLALRFAVCIHVGRTSLLKAMGGAGKGGGGRREGKGKSGKSWIELACDRFESRGRLEPGSGKGAVPQDTRAAVAARAKALSSPAPAARGGVFAPPPEDAPDEDETVEPVAAVGVQAVHQAALETHRMSSGRRASGFEPQRNTFYVCGRPVQVFRV